MIDGRHDGAWITDGRPTADAAVTVTGRRADLLGWLAGRRDGSALTRRRRAPPRTAPAIGWPP